MRKKPHEGPEAAQRCWKMSSSSRTGGRQTGAQSLAPITLRARPSAADHFRAQCRGSFGQTASLNSTSSSSCFHQSELLDDKQWGAYIDLFAAEGIYWMPAAPEQTEWLDSPSIFAEDKRMMEIRMGRVTQPNAWSQAPQWGTSHLVGNVVIEPWATQKSRCDPVPDDGVAPGCDRHFAGTTGHTLRRSSDDLKSSCNAWTC